jgi:hypothetical protein
MRSRRLDSWCLALALAACAPQDDRAPPTTGTGGSSAATTTGSGGNAGTGGSPGEGGAGGATGGTAGAGGSQDAALLDVADERARSDGAPDTPLVIIHDDAPSGGAPCPNGFTAVGSNRLRAGGATPAPFASAYNAELDGSSSAGPMLLALARIDTTKPFEWIATVGGLAAISGGGVGFVPPRADVPFTLAADRSLHIGPRAVEFALHFPKASAPASIAVASFSLEGAMSAGCGAVTVERATLLVPTSAGGVAFGGSTVAALMGNPTEAVGGVPNSAWRLDLAGTAAQVYAPGLSNDGGIEP